MRPYLFIFRETAMQVMQHTCVSNRVTSHLSSLHVIVLYCILSLVTECLELNFTDNWSHRITVVNEYVTQVHMDF